MLHQQYLESFFHHRWRQVGVDGAVLCCAAAALFELLEEDDVDDEEGCISPVRLSRCRCVELLEPKPGINVRHLEADLPLCFTSAPVEVLLDGITFIVTVR